MMLKRFGVTTTLKKDKSRRWFSCIDATSENEAIEIAKGRCDNPSNFDITAKWVEFKP